jgi:lambda family phage portal protein
MRKPKTVPKKGVVSRVRSAMRRGWQILATGYDAAENTRFIQNAFKNATDEAADAIINDSLENLRTRAKSEIRNNSYAEGIVETLSNDVVGTGARLQMATKSPNLNALTEREWNKWAKEVRLTETLQLMMKGQCGDGEALLALKQNSNMRNRVKLYPATVDPNRLGSPYDAADKNISMGVEYDNNGVAIAYHIAKQDSVNPNYSSIATEFVRVPATKMIHFYRKDRTGQSRGVPWITPAIPLFAYLRRYTLAVICSAETAADYSLILQSQSSNLETKELADMDVFDIERGMGMTVPRGWEAKQMTAEQPTDTYKEFKREILNEIARCVSMPYNVAAADSSDYNYASGRLDHQMYFKAVEVAQKAFEARVLDVLFERWFEQARAAGIFTQVRDVDYLEHEWMWDQFGHVDPLKEAGAEIMKLDAKTTTYKAVYAAEGKDYLREFEQIAQEKKEMESLGITSTEVDESRTEATASRLFEYLQKEDNQ